MHKDFGEWYRLAGIEPDREILPKRWAAIEEYDPDRAGVVSLARLFYRLGKPNSEFLAAFLGSFQKTDLAFKMRDNDHELSVLAGAKLVDVIEQSEADLADLAALSLVCASGGNLRPCPSVRDIPEIAARYLSERAIKRASLSEESADTGTNKERLAALTASETPQKELAREIQRLQRQLSIVAEESNMLWWLFSEHSRDEQQRWTKFNVPAVALMAGKELADLTTIIPGPIAAAAFLDKVIRCAKSEPPTTVLIRDAMNDVTIKWRQQYANEGCPSELEDLLPMTRAVHLSLASPENNAWLPVFKQGTGISSDAGLAPHILAHQVFLEALLCRSWKQLN
jgi:hypothetical protein